MVTNHLVMPVKDELAYTDHIVKQILSMEGWNVLHIFDNGSKQDTVDYLEGLNNYDGIMTYDTPSPEYGIYDMWDAGFRVSQVWGADIVTFINNDIDLHPDTFVALNDALEARQDHWIAYPDYNADHAYGLFCNYKYTKGTYRHGGMSGYCFALKASRVTWSPLVDPQFKWWCGDDDIAFNVEKNGGKQIRVVGLPIGHANEGTARHHDLGAQKAADMTACLTKWGK